MARERSQRERCEVVVMWGEGNVLCAAHVRPEQGFRLGSGGGDGRGADYVVGDGLLDGSHSLVEDDGGFGQVHVPHGARAFASDAEGQWRAVRAGGSVPLHAGGCVRIQWGELLLVVRQVELEDPQLGPVMRLAAPVLRWLGASAALHGVVLGAMYFLPPQVSALSLDLEYQDELWADMELKANVLDDVEEQTPDWLEASEEAGGASGTPGPEGAAGDPEAPRGKKRAAVRGKQQPRVLSREQARAQAADAGILGVLGRAAASPISHPSGADFAQGYDLDNALGQLLGETPGTSFGFNGLGMRGTGRASGLPQGDVRVGALGTRGRGLDGPGGVGFGTTRARKRRGISPPRICATRSSCRAEVKGSLSKEAIRRVIHRNRQQVRFCYEQGLLRQPDMGGRLTVRFVISPDGSVQAAGTVSSDLKDARVAQCVAKKVSQWPFPKPEGGGVVVVTYPFVFATP